MEAKRVKCERCGGRGQVPQLFIGLDDTYVRTGWLKCPECGGHGSLPLVGPVRCEITGLQMADCECSICIISDDQIHDPWAEFNDAYDDD